MGQCPSAPRVLERCGPPTRRRSGTAHSYAHCMRLWRRYFRCAANGPGPREPRLVSGLPRTPSSTRWPTMSDLPQDALCADCVGFNDGGLQVCRDCRERPGQDAQAVPSSPAHPSEIEPERWLACHDCFERVQESQWHRCDACGRTPFCPDCIFIYWDRGSFCRRCADDPWIT